MARLPVAVRERAAQLRSERGWTPAYALRRASAEARGLTPAQARGVHPDEPQYRRILGARTQTRFRDAATGAVRISGQVVDPTGPGRAFVVTIVTEDGRSVVYRFDVRQQGSVVKVLDDLRKQGHPVPDLVGTP